MQESTVRSIVQIVLQKTLDVVSEITTTLCFCSSIF